MRAYSLYLTTLRDTMIERARSIAIMLLAIYAVFAHSGNAFAAEGASSLYIPGGAGDVLIALSPRPGFQIANGVFWQDGKVDRAVLQGAVDLDIDLTLILDFFGGSYTFEKPVLGGTYTIGAVVPFGYAKLDASATGPGGGTQCQ